MLKENWPYFFIFFYVNLSKKLLKVLWEYLLGYLGIVERKPLFLVWLSSVVAGHRLGEV